MPNNASSKITVISLGGAIIYPTNSGIDIDFLKKFRRLILGLVKKGRRFIIVAGGGKICRLYLNAASKIIKTPDEDMDWLGIHVTRLNAHLLRTIFWKEACPVVLDSPFKKVKKDFLKKPIIIASGWRPGNSSDWPTVMLAKRFKAKEVINAGNVTYVFDKDPEKYKDAKAIKNISWSEYQKIVGEKWVPGLSAPFDPIASMQARKSKIRALIVKGTDLKNLAKALAGEEFRGTIIS